jgi:dihydroorotate dehydrogenase electron transfer subunit
MTWSRRHRGAHKRAAKNAAGEVSAVLGFRTKDRMLLTDEFRSVCRTVDIATDDGSFGVHGFVTDPLEKRLGAGGWDNVLACGPCAMLKAVADVCASFGIPCQVSLEERMGCGVGACLVCACKTMKDGEQMSRVCKDGPVFNAT